MSASSQTQQRAGMATTMSPTVAAAINSLLLNHSGARTPSLRQRKLFHRRDLTSDMRIGKIYTFEDVKAVAGKNKNVIIIDSREPYEIIETGRIPGAVNIPIDSVPESFSISEEEFEDRFGYSRPPKDSQIVTYCKAGIRCHTAAHLARLSGYKNVNEYPGSFLDWVANNGEVERT